MQSKLNFFGKTNLADDLIAYVPPSTHHDNAMYALVTNPRRFGSSNIQQFSITYKLI